MEINLPETFLKQYFENAFVINNYVMGNPIELTEFDVKAYHDNCAVIQQYLKCKMMQSNSQAKKAPRDNRNKKYVPRENKQNMSDGFKNNNRYKKKDKAVSVAEPTNEIIEDNNIIKTDDNNTVRENDSEIKQE
jgi:hypothetical protein